MSSIRFTVGQNTGRIPKAVNSRYPAPTSTNAVTGRASHWNGPPSKTLCVLPANGVSEGKITLPAATLFVLIFVLLSAVASKAALCSRC